MHIVKNLKDYQLNHKQRLFASYLKENISTYSCNEEITNKAYLRKYFSPENDFTVYSVGCSADPARLLKKNIV